MDPTTRPRRLAAVVIASFVLLASACVAPASTPSPAPTPIPTPAPGSIVPVASEPVSSPAVTGAQVCADLAAFQASIDTLKGLDLSTARVADVLQAVSAAITTGTALVESSKAAFGPEAQALATALSGLQAALAGVTEEGTLLDKAATIENAIDGVAAAFDALKAELTPGCASPAPSGG
jgi:hypothetical protein